MNHRQHNTQQKSQRRELPECTAHDMTFGNRCLNCGWNDRPNPDQDTIVNDQAWYDQVDQTTPVLVESMVEEIRKISAWYDAHNTTLSPVTFRQWGALATASQDHAVRMIELYKVRVEYVDGQPYQTATDMFQHIRTGLLLISRENTEHPIWPHSQVLTQRIWHDLTHYEIQSDFSFKGEVDTCYKQIAHIPDRQADKEDIHHALYVDIVGQVCNGFVHRRFPVQKVF